MDRIEIRPEKLSMFQEIFELWSLWLIPSKDIS